MALQMLLADVVIGADDAALEDRKITFNRICVSIAAHIFASAMIDRLMARKLFANMEILAAFIGHQCRFTADLFNQDRTQGLTTHMGHMERAHLAPTLHDLPPKKWTGLSCF